MSLWKEFLPGLWREHPIFRMLLGMCPVLAVSTEAVNGLGMGLATLFVLTSSNVTVSLARHWIPKRVRIPSYIVVIASFVTLVDLLMAGYFYQLHKSLGLFIPLIVVNCIILGRSEAFASRNPVVHAAVDGLGMGIGFTIGLTILAGVREILGNGTLFGVSLLGEDFTPFLMMVLPPGAFIVLGFLVAGMNAIDRWRAVTARPAAEGHRHG